MNSLLWPEEFIKWMCFIINGRTVLISNEYFHVGVSEPAEEERDGRKKKYPSPQKTRSESSERRFVFIFN